MDQPPSPIEILRDIIIRYGPPSESNQRMYSGLMMDLLVDHPRELNLLKLPLEQGLVLRLMKEYHQTPYNVIINQMVKYLHTNFGIDINAARWSIDIWAQVLEIQQNISNNKDFLADFTCKNTSGYVPFKTSFTPNFVNSEAKYHWNFGDGEESCDQNPTHEYRTPGFFSVTLQVSQEDNIEENTKSSFIQIQSNHLSLIDTELTTSDSDYSSNKVIPGLGQSPKNNDNNIIGKFIVGGILLICIICTLGFFFSGSLVEGGFHKTGVNSDKDIPNKFFYEKNLSTTYGTVSDEFTWKIDNPSKNFKVICYPKLSDDLFCPNHRPDCINSISISKNSWIDIRVIDISGNEIIHDGFGKEFGYGVPTGSTYQGDQGYEKTFNLFKQEPVIISYSGQNVNIIMELVDRKQ